MLIYHLVQRRLVAAKVPGGQARFEVVELDRFAGQFVGSADSRRKTAALLAEFFTDEKIPQIHADLSSPSEVDRLALLLSNLRWRAEWVAPLAPGDGVMAGAVARIRRSKILADAAPTNTEISGRLALVGVTTTTEAIKESLAAWAAAGWPASVVVVAAGVDRIQGAAAPVHVLARRWRSGTAATLGLAN